MDAQKPPSINDDYIRIYNSQDTMLDEIEKTVLKLEELLAPVQDRRIFDADILKTQPPSRSTTWMIIYIVLGFLALMSLLFYLRWYGKSKEEKM